MRKSQSHPEQLLSIQALVSCWILKSVMTFVRYIFIIKKLEKDFTTLQYANNFKQKLKLKTNSITVCLVNSSSVVS